ncbi:MAG TPA: ABC transporter permease [Candidatus Cybelea sp.]|nr:ABC transporter permease [Candidatus Cybelea sp.]
MGTLRQDFLYSLRMLAKSPGFALIAILTLALGIGATTAVFSVVEGVLLNPLPYEHPEHLVAVYARSKQFQRSSISYPNFLDWVRDSRSLSGLAAFRADDFDLTGMGEPERVAVEMVSANFFRVLGVKPVLGRSFDPQEDQVGAPPVVMISGGLWQAKFGSSRDVLSRSIELNGKAYTIVGVIPAKFRYDSGNFHPHCDVFVPIGQWDDATFRNRRTGMGMDAVGRLNPGVTLAQAQSDMDSVAQHLAETYPDIDKGQGITLVPLKENVVGDIRPFLLVLLAAVAFVLLIACANVASLLLARSTGRGREFAIRAALGASPGRVIRQLLTESCLLSLVGGILGLLLAGWGTKAAIRAIPEALPRADSIGVDASVLGFAFAVSMFTGILFGLVPALRSAQPNLAETLKEEGRGSSGVRHRTQRILVVIEMAVAVLLLIGAGLMMRSLGKLWSVDPGFDAHNVLTLSVSSPQPLGATPATIREALRAIQSTLAGLPGVENASLNVGSVPMESDSELPFWLAGQPKPLSESEMKATLFDAVQSDYLKVMRVPLLRGRFLRANDDEHSPEVVVIDEEFARLIFGHQDPIGKRVNFDILNTSPEIVGVVGHVKQWGLDENGHGPVQAQCYLPIAQIPDQFLSLLSRGTQVFLRTAGPPLAQTGAVRQALERYNSQLVAFDVESMDGIISDSLASRRFSMILLGIFAGLALLLSAVGAYGVISYLWSQRTREIGLRMALGAHPLDVLRLIMGQGAALALAGIGIGAAAALALTRLMGQLLYGIPAYDPLTFIGVALLLSIVGFAACYIPAQRAMRVDPMVALRHE